MLGKMIKEIKRKKVLKSPKIRLGSSAQERNGSLNAEKTAMKGRFCIGIRKKACKWW
jgi:hypothetical protein